MSSIFRSSFVRSSRPILSHLLSSHCPSRLQRFSLQQCRLIAYGSKIFVGGLSPQVTEEQLKDAFSSFGEVIDAKVIIDIASGRSRGFAFVRFISDSHANVAVRTMNGRELNGRILRVSLADKPNTYGGGLGASRYSDGGDYGQDDRSH
ncbi:hypothetical protein KP509_32G066700 [Ceratopteris richardii]|uniref:RRM domain-containing protein n=1 Tax=Ceratopteris richardii TaxID=49495 RepID=A0A8T2QU43_CERRI|nr:hypothetical protein KP509_32G066700 [Ceratopteris richardii]